jgi:hypothetical protein
MSIRQRKHQRLFSDLVESLVLFMDLQPKRINGETDPKLSLRHFDMAEPLIPEAFVGVSDDRVFVDPQEVTPSVLENQWNSCVLKIANDDDLCKGERYQMYRFRSVSHRSLRRLPFVSPVLGELAVARLFEDGHYEADRKYLAWKGGRFWTFAQDEVPHTMRALGQIVLYDAFDDRVGRMGLSTALTQEYQWHIGIGLEELPRVAFPTDPTGVRAAFRFRDIPAGKARRAALIHWVTEHWRKHRDVSNEDRIWVREHLRGATDFSWNGLRCTIRPSKADMARSGREINERSIGTSTVMCPD